MIAILINLALVAATAMIHYETFRVLGDVLPRLGRTHRFRILCGVLGAVVAHTIEIMLFAFAYFFMIRSGRFGWLHGSPEQSLADCSYFSYITYTTAGYGDIVPLGELRYLAGIESLTGLVMIAWTASYLFIEMQKTPGDKK